MNRIEAAHAVDRSKSNEELSDPSELMELFGFGGLEFDWMEVAETIKEYWLIKWKCTDTHVGTMVGILNDKPVYIKSQSARKSPPVYEFITKESINVVREALMKLLKEELPSLSVADPDEEIEDFYSVPYAEMMLAPKGFYQGKSVSIKRMGYRADECVKIIFDKTGEEMFVPVKDIKIRLHVE